MIRQRKCFSGLGRKDERGQALLTVIVWLVFVVAMLAVVVDLGTVYVSYRQLQASTDAAALAAGQDLPNGVTSGANTNAQLFSSLPGGKNVYTDLSGVSMPTSGATPDPLFYCSTTLSGLGLPCTSATPVLYNAVRVQQKATVPLNILRFFTSFLGAHVTPSLNIMTTSTSSGRLLNGGPYNVVVILDTTQSMQSGDGDAANNPNCSGHSKIWCAMQGVQTFLANITPCYTSPCSGSDSGDNYSNPLNEVALMVFPGFKTSGAGDISVLGTGLNNTYPWEVMDEYDYTRPGTGSPLITSTNISNYTQYCTGSGTPPTCVGTTQISEMVEQYEIVPFSSDYWASSATTAPAALNTSSNLVEAVKNPPYYGGAPLGPPWGLADIGGKGTFYAGVLAAAENALIAEQAARTAAGSPGTQNVIILLSDGDATATSGDLTGYSTAAECTQAVQAAQSATSAGTIVYAVAYGAESRGCSGDTYNPCSTMKAIASSASDFFSDDTTSGSGAGCVGTAFTSSNLTQIFTFIASQFKTARLMPNGTP